jgi:uncharacterized protein (TIRG00374 family)
MLRLHKNWLAIAKLLFGVALIAVLVLRVDAGVLAQRFRSLNLAYVALVFILPHVSMLLSTVKWRALLGVLDVHVGLWRLFGLYMMGTFFSNFLPSMVGGDVFKSYALSRETGEASSVVAGTFMERFVGLAALVSLLPLVQMQPAVTQAMPMLGLFIWCVVGGYLVSVALVLSPERLYARSSQKAAGIWQRVWSFLESTHHRISRFRSAPMTLLGCFGLSLVFYVLAVATAWAATRSVGAEVEFYYLLAVLPLVWLAGMIPISLNGLGITEAGYAIFLQLVGVTPEDALTVALLVRFRLLITALLGGLVFLRHRAEHAE